MQGAVVCPGQLFSCLCREEDTERLTGLIQRHTTTWGVRRQVVERTMLERRVERIEPPLVKIGGGDGFSKRKPEHDQLAALAREAGISVARPGRGFWAEENRLAMGGQ